MKHLKLFEQFDDPFGEESSTFEDIIIPPEDIDGTYYMIKESMVWYSGIPNKQNIIMKMKLKRKGNKIYYYMWNDKNVMYDSTYDAFLNVLRTFYPKGNVNEYDWYYLFTEEDWTKGSDRVKYIFDNLLHIDFEEYKEVLEYVLNRDYNYGQITSRDLESKKKWCEDSGLTFILANYLKLSKKVKDEQDEIMRKMKNKV